MGQWRGVIGAKTQLEEAALMIEALQITGGAQDIMIQIFAVREGVNEKKKVFFRALPELPNPPPTVG